MEWLTSLFGTVVGLDTAPLIYFIEKHPKYFGLVRPFFEPAELGDLRVVTSTLTLTEVLAHPLRHGDPGLAERYAFILQNARNVRILPVSASIAVEAARIRAGSGAKTPDAIQLATARDAGATAFLTNDASIAAIPGLQFIKLDRLL